MEIFALSGLINAIIAFTLGVFIIFRNWRKRVNQLYFLIVIAIVIWSLGYWQWLSSDDATSALFWVRIFSIGATLIPIFYFHWIVSLLGIIKREKKAVILVYIIGFLFLFFSFSELFVKGVSERSFFPFWPDPGILYHFYLIFNFVLLVLYSLFLLFKNYKIVSGEKKMQIIYILIGSIIAFAGAATNFFLWYNILIPPYGNFLVALYPVIFGYAMIKHHLFDIRIIATETLTFAIWAFLLIRTILSKTHIDILINSTLLIAVFIVGILLIRSVLKEVKQREKLQAMTNKIKKAYEIEKKAREDLERLDQAKSQFIMATQHHLRTPLTSMVGYVDLIIGGTYGKVSEKLKTPILKFKASTSKLIRIVNELLDISQFQLGKKVVTLQPNIEIESMLTEMVEELRFEADHKGIYLKLDKPDRLFTIKADPQKLKVALYNLADNAIKYTKEGGVTISVTSNAKLTIKIKDTGIGMNKEELSNIFTRTFERGEEAKQVFATGRGIGLFITYQIIKAHDGRVWAESEGKGKGSTFFIELPV